MSRPKSMFLRAKPGMRVPYPDNSYRYLEDSDAIEVPMLDFAHEMYWQRRIDHGEVERVEQGTVAVSPERAKELGAPTVMTQLPTDLGKKKEG